MSAARFTHLVVGVCGELPGHQAIEMAAEMARVFSAEFSALMIEDGSSDILACLPFAREYVPGRAGWQEIGASDIEARRSSVRRRARDVFSEIASAQGLIAGFEVLKGGAPGDLAGAIAHYDIVALAAPAQAGEWMMLPFSAFGDAALHARAVTLFLPARIARRTGPVAALLNAGDHAGLELAAQLARATGERMVILAAGLQDTAREAEAFAAQADLPRERLRIIDIDGGTLGEITQMLGDTGERMLVLGRAFLPQPGLEHVIRLAAARGIPVFIPGAPGS